MLHLQYLADLASRYAAYLNLPVNEFSIGARHFAWNSQPYLMGVINLSADSCYRESVCLSPEAAIARGSVLQAQGADIVDLGAESTLANAAKISDAAQNSKLLPVIRALSASGNLISVETYHPAVARACLEAGARILNLTGTENASEFYQLAREHGAAVILCYVQGKNVRDVGDFQSASDPIAAMQESFARQIDLATHLGLEKLLIDPGLGFYYRNLQDSVTRVRHQMTIFLETFRLRQLGFPICHALPHAFEYFTDEVRSAEPFFAVLAALGQTSLFRTHEVPKVRAVLQTLGVFEKSGPRSPAPPKVPSNTG